MLGLSRLQLHRIDLGVDTHNTLTGLIKLLAPHVPYSFQVLGSILNSGPRPCALQDIDPSTLSLWSTVPLSSDVIDHPALFSIVAFSHPFHQFCFFCSAESREPFKQPSEEEEAHVRQLIEHLRNIARETYPTYDSIAVALGNAATRHCVDTDPSMILVGAVHPKWTNVLAPMSESQKPCARYVFRPRAGRAHMTGVELPVGLSIAEIQALDLPFVHGASSVPRSDAYILSRVPYSVCVRSHADGEEPVGCALMHSDGSIGAVRVGARYQRQGLGRLIVRALMEKLDFTEGREDAGLLSGYHFQDVGGGALGWNWTDVGAWNEVGSCFFSSLVSEQDMWTNYWTYILVKPDQ